MTEVIESLDRDFAQLYSEWREVAQNLDAESLYTRVGSSGNARELSCGEHLVKSAGIVEQTFGGITANLWDDPFEWTLPETLSTTEKLLAYFDEVEATRQRGFELFKTDAELCKTIMAPSGETELLTLLLDTLARAVHHCHGAKETLDSMMAGDTAA